MPLYSIPIAEAIVAITAGSANGELEMSDNAALFPGAYAWLMKTDGTRLRVLIVKRTGTTKIHVRKARDFTEQSVPGPNYGYVDVSAFSAGSVICQEAQTAPVTSDYIPRVIG